MFIAAAVMKGITCVVQCYNNNPTAELVFRFIKALRAELQWENG